jgi:hypothetical protein
MTHVDDLYEPGDDREPDEPEQEPIFSLDQIEGALAAYRRGQDPREGLDPHERSHADQAESFLLDTAVPQMLAELRGARQRIAEFEALPTREEWVVTPGRDSAPGDGVTISCDVQADHAKWLARSKDAQMWRRMLSVHPWEPIANEAPF